MAVAVKIIRTLVLSHISGLWHFYKGFFFDNYYFPLTFAAEKDRKEGNGRRSLFIYPVPTGLCICFKNEH
jgi:hypothetical protein